jgi:hypothetical protein
VGRRAAWCADALMLREGAGGRGRRRSEGRSGRASDGRLRGLKARVREFVGTADMKELKDCMPWGGGGCGVLLTRGMLTAERVGGRICILEGRG